MPIFFFLPFAYVESRALSSSFPLGKAAIAMPDNACAWISAGTSSELVLCGKHPSGVCKKVLSKRCASARIAQNASLDCCNSRLAFRSGVVPSP